MSEELETRDIEVQYREDEERGYLEGLAMPNGEVTTVRNPDGTTFRERFEAGAIENEGTVWLYNGHKDPVGEVEHSEYREDGFFIRARLALSDLAKSTRDALRSGAITGLSVGFVAQSFRMDGDVKVITRARLREVSVTPRPAYPGATVLSVRQEETVREDTDALKEATMSDQDNTQDLTEVRNSIEELDRKIELLSTRENTHETPAVDTRSAAEVLKAIVSGDDETVRSVSDVQTRAYTGGTTADGGATLKPGYVGDLTRIFDASSGVLASVFSTGTLPSSGMSLEYSILNTNTAQVTEQTAEGNDLAYGKVTLTNASTPVRTFGGYTQLTRQEIERSTLPLLQRNLEAQALAAGARLKVDIRAAVGTLVTQQTAVASNGGVVLLGSTLSAATYNGFTSAIVDGAVKFSQNNLNMEVLVVSATVFKALTKLNGSDGRPMLSLDNSGSNTVGHLSVTALNGQLAGVPVVLDADQSGDSAFFADSRALRVYASGVVSLQDENIVNLSKTFSVYRYAAFAPAIPAGLVPLKLAAS